MEYRIPRNTANVISIIRIFLTVVLWYLIYLNNSVLFFSLSIVTYLTDILDGFVARTFQLESDLGRKLDSLGDFFYFLTLLFGVIYFFQGFFLENIITVVLLLLFGSLGYVYVLLRFRKYPTAHLRTAQVWGYWLVIFVVLAFLYQPQQWLLYVMTIHALIVSIEVILFYNLHTKPEHENLHSYFALKKQIEKESI